MNPIRRLILAGAISGLAAAAAPTAALAAPADLRFIDGDGSRTVFTTTERMTPQDTDNVTDVYLRSGGTTQLISTGPVGGNGNFAASAAGIAEFNNSDRVVFLSGERLTADDLDNSQDVYSRENGQTIRLSKGSGQFTGNAALSTVVEDVLEDGTVVMRSNEKLDADDTDGTAADIYVYDQSLGFASGASQQNGTGGSANTPVSWEGASPGGGELYFSTTEKLSTDDGDAGSRDIYLYDPNAPDKLVTLEPGADEDVAMDYMGSTAGGLVAFETSGDYLDNDADGSDIDVYTQDVDNDTPTHVSNDFDTLDVDYAGISPTDDKVYIETNDDQTSSPASDPDTVQDVYELDASAGSTTKVSAGNGPFGASFQGSDDAGGHVAYSTAESLTGIDGDNFIDLYEKEGVVQTDLISQRENAGAEEAATPTFRGYSANGERVLYSTSEKITSADTDAAIDIYGRNGEGASVKVTPGNGSGSVAFAATSEDATTVAYETQESLVSQDGDNEVDAYSTRGTATTLESFELVPPQTTITGGPTGVINNPVPVFSAASSEAGSTLQCRFDGAAFGSCAARPRLGDGPHTFQARAIDRLGNVDATPAARSFRVDTRGPALTVSKKARRANKKGRFTITVICPAGETGGCTGRLVLKSTKKVKLTKKKRRVVTFASKSFSLEPGQRANITLALSKKNRRVLKKLRKGVGVTATAEARDGLGNARTSTAKLKLSPPKAKKKRK